MRVLLTVIVGSGAFFVLLVLLGLAGVTATHFQVPLAIFGATMALWPVVKPVMKDSFKQYAAYQATVLVVMMALIYAVNTWIRVQRQIDSLGQ
jgi:hypothetical protein